MNVRHSLLLTAMLSTSVLLSACGGDENLQLGTRDDIIIMKNGVPVDGNAVADAVTTTPSNMTVNTAATVPSVKAAQAPAPKEMADGLAQNVEEQATEVVEEQITETASDIEQMVEEKAVEPVTEVQMVETAATDSVDEIVSQANEAVDQVAQDVAGATEIEMKQAKSVNTKLMSADLAEDMAQEVVSSNDVMPMATTPMKEAVSQSNVMDTTPMKIAEMSSEAVEEAPSDSSEMEQIAETPEKVEGGCYRNMLVATTNAVPVMEERRVVCDKDLTPSLVAIIQQALITRDVKIGAADGKIGNKTLNAIETYQRENGLAVGGVTYELLTHLGIKI